MAYPRLTGMDQRLRPVQCIADGQRRVEKLCNAFGVNVLVGLSTQGAPFDKLTTTLGFGV
jgi:hypothetical protein